MASRDRKSSFLEKVIGGNICTKISAIKCLTAMERVLIGDIVTKFGV